jgi:predicted metal-dependent hydrolase
MKKSHTKNIAGIGPVLFERSQRAKRVIISIKPYKGIRVAVPSRVSFEKAEDFTITKTDWIQKHLKRIKQYESEKKAVQADFENIDTSAAKRIIVGKLKQLAKKYGFTFNKVSIRNQRTRWGSCSHNNNISLNMKLVRLSPDLIEYVILHELVHTRVHNHSRTFWAELDKYTGNGKLLAARLRKEGNFLL